MDKYPDIKNILEVLDEVTEWYSLGVYLGLEPFKLKIIEKDHEGDVVRQKLEMLILYCSSNDFDWRDIVVALTKMKLFCIAYRIAHQKGKHLRSRFAVIKRNVGSDMSLVRTLLPMHNISLNYLHYVIAHLTD